MKNMKKLVSLMLTLVMAMSLTVTAFADDPTYTVTIENSAAGHTYEAYQIFKGDLSGQANPDATSGTTAILSNIQWGEGVTYPTDGFVIGKGAGDEDIKSTAASEVAEALADANNTFSLDSLLAGLTLDTPVKTVDTQSNGVYVISGLAAGYYLIKDADSSLTGEYDAYTSYIIEVVEDSKVVPKSAIPTVDKQVKDEADDKDSKTGDTYGWGETADHAMNESFQFELVATIPANDNLADYESYKVVFTDTMSAGITFESIASVKVGTTDVPGTVYACTATEGQKGGSWTLTIADIMAYDKDLVDGAVVTVIYNAHLNEAAKLNNEDENKNSVKLQYSNNPYLETELGETEQDHVWVFTYTMNNKKVDGTNNKVPLAGAGFRLYSAENCTVETEIHVIYDDDLEAYRLTKTGETGEEMFSAETSGEFNIVGLDTGVYYLKETTTPAGYNTGDVVKVEISATHSEDSTSGEGSTGATTTVTMKQGEAETDVNEIVNNKGIVLPETGGVGTTIFYIAGAVLVLGAAVLLITKRRMNTDR